VGRRNEKAIYLLEIVNYLGEKNLIFTFCKNKIITPAWAMLGISQNKIEYLFPGFKKHNIKRLKTDTVIG
jgi:hypothetical protein